MYNRKEETSLEMAMSAAIAAVRTRNGNMTSEEVLKEAKANTTLSGRDIPPLPSRQPWAWQSLPN